MLSALTAPGGQPLLPCTPTSHSASTSHDIIHLLRNVQEERVLTSENRQLINQAILQLKPINNLLVQYVTSPYADGSWLTLMLDTTGQATMTAYKAGKLANKITITSLHPAWDNINNCFALITLIDKWRVWAASPTPGEQRDEALRRVTECIVREDTLLELNSLGLSSLPALPGNLTEVHVCNNKLPFLCRLPTNLKSLDARNNRLNTLPNLPNMMSVLNVSNNLLTALPDLPEGLTELYANDNRLTALPKMPTTLRIINLHNNRLSTQYTRPLLDKVACWYPAKQRNAVRMTWIALAIEENEAAFTRFLLRLEQNICARDPAFRKQVANWLAELVITQELRLLSYAIAQEASETCTDRAALGWNNMQVARLLFHSIRNERTTAQDFLILSQQIFRLRQIEQIASEKVLALTSVPDPINRVVDEIEVYLAYQTKLKEALHLPDVFAARMNFEFLSRITAEDINLARETIHMAEENGFKDWLSNWEPCQHYLMKQLSPDEQDALTDRRIAVYDEQLEYFRQEYNDAGTGTDVDRVLGKQATGATNTAIFGPMIEQTFFVKPIRMDEEIVIKRSTCILL